MTITVDLKRDECREYKYWSDYCKQEKQSAVFDLAHHSIESVLPTWNQTKRTTYRQSIKKGYTSRQVSWHERNGLLEDIHQINTSKSVRQKRPMAAHYLEFPREMEDQDTCADHGNFFVGCFNGGTLYAYIAANVCGEITACSQILGHGDKLQDGIMLNLWHEFVRIAIGKGTRIIVYSRWSDGHDGLKSWKTAIGMRPVTLIEAL